MIKAVLFDFHNTLATCDEWLELEIKTLPGLALRKLADKGLIEVHSPQNVERANAIFRQLRQRVRESGLEVSAIDGVLEVLREMDFDALKVEVGQVVAELEHACLPQVQMIPGTDHALEHLRDAGYQMGVVSSAGYPPFVELALEAIGLRAYFSEVITSAGEGLYKSNPELYRLSAARLDAAPDEAVHVGDHPAFDVEAAKAAGLRAIWFTAQSRRTAELRGEPWYDPTGAQTKADAIVSSMDELYEEIRRL
jgi:HAD superfamily hydrolase (TIGR01509 family)